MTTWRTLESTIALDELPNFHRKFLEWRSVKNVSGMPLRRVQQRVESELNKMALEGKTNRLEGDWELLEGALNSFEPAQAHI